MPRNDLAALWAFDPGYMALYGRGEPCKKGETTKSGCIPKDGTTEGADISPGLDPARREEMAELRKAVGSVDENYALILDRLANPETGGAMPRVEAAEILLSADDLPPWVKRSIVGAFPEFDV